MLDGIDVFRITGARMHHLAARQEVLSRNIANADTPYYRAQDVKAFRFDSALLRNQPGTADLTLAATRPGHLGLPRNGVNVAADRADTYSEDPDGNTVNLEQQMMKQVDVAKAYDMATSVYRASMSMLRTAVGGGR